MNDKWLNNICADGDWCGSWFDTRDDAIEDGRKQYREALAGEYTDLFDDCDDLSAVGHFYVARAESFMPTIDAEYVIDCIIEQAYDFGGEHGEDYLNGVPRPDIDDLQSTLQKALDDWLWRTKNKPTFFRCIETEEVEVIA